MAGKKIDRQLVELAGRHWLTSQLLQAGLEVARPERDRGIDLIAYVDFRQPGEGFVACPIQMKAATKEIFGLDPKYSKFPGLILAYVWNLGNPSETKCYALTYDDAFVIADTLGWTTTKSFQTGGRSKKPRYITTKPSKDLRNRLAAYEMNSERWLQKVNSVAASAAEE